jgi:peptidoglycan/LPS O-acetylase OafA/YrhL
MTRLARVVVVISGVVLAAMTIEGGLNVVPQGVMTKGAIVSKCVSFSIAGAFFGSLLVLLLKPLPGTRWIRQVFNLQGLRWVGKYSYGIYLLHYTLAPLSAALFPLALLESRTGSLFLARFIYFVLASALTIGAAFVSWHVWEKHFLSMKRSFRY